MYQEQAEILSSCYGLNSEPRTKQVNIKPIGDGHINATFLLQVQQEVGSSAVVQKIVQKLNTMTWTSSNMSPPQSKNTWLILMVRAGEH
jgi:uncharacterized protein YmfQ (DUF2313 family)